MSYIHNTVFKHTAQNPHGKLDRIAGTSLPDKSPRTQRHGIHFYLKNIVMSERIQLTQIAL